MIHSGRPQLWTPAWFTGGGVAIISVLKAILEELKPIFYPRGIAVIGASSNPTKLSYHWIRGLTAGGFPGGIYPVNPAETEVYGRRAYASVKDIPGPVDLVIVCVPRRLVPSIIADCGLKGVKAAHLFTGGFSESGRPEDRAAEEEVVRLARRAGIRIIGPNCMGVYHPAARIPWGPSDLMGDAGAVGFLSQSGGHAVKMAEIGVTSGISYSKMVSYGNGADLDSADFIEYLGADPATEIIGAYLEGCREGRRLLEALSSVSKSKPVVVWKGGRTVQGAEAAASHTGAVMAAGDLWSSALKQAGAIPVADMEELADTLLLFQQVKRLPGSRLGVICGLTDGGGGESVLSADACASEGLEVPRFSTAARERLAAIFGEVGSVLRNPLDVSQGYGDVAKLRRALEIVLAEPYIDILAIYENVEILARFLSERLMGEMNAMFIEFNRRKSKPLVCVLPRGGNDSAWLEARSALLKGGIPVFTSTARAARAIANVRRYTERMGASHSEEPDQRQ